MWSGFNIHSQCSTHPSIHNEHEQPKKTKKMNRVISLNITCKDNLIIYQNQALCFGTQKRWLIGNPSLFIRSAMTLPSLGIKHICIGNSPSQICLRVDFWVTLWHLFCFVFLIAEDRMFKEEFSHTMHAILQGHTCANMLTYYCFTLRDIMCSPQ